MAGIPEIIDRKETEKQIAERLAELEALLQETEKLRHRQFLISGVTMLLMLAVLIAFLIGLAAFFRTYPKRLLIQEVARQEQMVSDCLHLSGTDRNFGRKMIHGFFHSIHREQPFRKSVFRHKLRSEIHALNQYAQQELRPFFRNQLYLRLREETLRYLTEKNLTPGGVQKSLIRQLNLELSAELANRMFRESGAADRAFSLFREETGLLRQSPWYRELAQEPFETIENRMLENLLECLICRLNESKAFADPERSHGHE